MPRPIVDQLIAIYNSAKPYDAFVLIRGGGTQTDLLLFEQYAIGRAIATFMGHQVGLLLNLKKKRGQIDLILFTK